MYCRRKPSEMHNVNVWKIWGRKAGREREESIVQISGRLDAGVSFTGFSARDRGRLCCLSGGKEFSRCSEGMGVLFEKGEKHCVRGGLGSRHVSTKVIWSISKRLAESVDGEMDRVRSVECLLRR